MIELRNLTYEVEENGEKRRIIDRLNLKIDKHKFIVITGPNGSGKSTLARLIAGIDQPTEGQILLDGNDITKTTITERAKSGISFAFQQPVRFKGITVMDLLRMASDREITVSEACDYLSEVGLCAKDYIRREVNQSLSGGELKRIEIATVLARGTQFSIFDEPEAGIDLWSFQNLISVFERMRQKDADRSIIVISHQERILNIADEIMVLSGGVITKRGTKDEILPGLLGTSAAVDACFRLNRSEGVNA